MSRMETITCVDQDYEKLKEQTTQDAANHKQFMVKGDRTYKLVVDTKKLTDRRYEWKHYPPTQVRDGIMRTTHEPAHLGYDKTINYLKEKFYWPRMATDTKIYCKSCMARKTSKATKINSTSPMGSQKKCFATIHGN